MSTLAMSGAASFSAQQDDTQTSTQTQETSYVRIAHLSPDAPAVNVTLGNQTVASNVEFGNVTEYMNVTAGTYNVSITPVGQPTNAIFEGNVTIEPRVVATIAASGEFSSESMTDFEPATFEDNAWKPSDDMAAVSIVNLSPDVGSVDVVVTEGPSDGQTGEETETETDVVGEETETETETDVGVGNETGTETDVGVGNETETETETDVGMGNETETATDEGMFLAAQEETDTETETDDGLGNETETETDVGVGNETETETDVGVGNETETETETDVVGTETETETETDMVGNETETDMDEQLTLAQNVTFRNASEYMNVPAGDYTLEIRSNETGETLATVDLSVEGGNAYTAFLAGYQYPDEAPAGASFQLITVQDATKSVTLPTVEAGAETETGTETDVVGEETETETETDVGIGNETETETETDVGIGNETETATDDGLGTETETETDVGIGTETETETDDGLGVETETDTATEAGA
ncbi:DUF4397 domain-containing protein [Halosimplex aquaticum]|uniref:DUF4397 domain-containing protein n=1 Tax=Halosimplex aquaticum TaxID=3026162 RepID=A0ABD5Y858_9EURY|nr:DUF4397 domain-containing protein [Halosimplex aquaticum]